MSVLITGGAGYIGSALVKQLLEDGYHVVVVDNLYRGNYEPLRDYEQSGRLDLLVMDICDIKALDKAVEDAGGVEAIFHLAAVPGMRLCARDPDKAVMTNVYGSYNVLEVARNHDVDKVVLTSSAAVYGDPVELPVRESHPTNPKNLYGITKLAAEHLFASYHELYGLPTVVLRLGNVYGVGLFTYWETVIPKFVNQALSGKPLSVYGTGTQTRDFIHVWDVVEAMRLVLEARGAAVAGETFNVATGKPVSINEVAEAVSRAVWEECRIEVEISHVESPRKGETTVPGFCLSADKIREKLGFRPSWEFEDGVRQLIRYRLLSMRPGKQGISQPPQHGEQHGLDEE